MIYLISGQINNIVTDSTLTYIPELIDVTLDDVQLGEYQNLSTQQRYIKLGITLNEITENKENKEYRLNLYVDGALIKSELAVVMKQDEINYSTTTNSNTKIIQYERSSF